PRTRRRATPRARRRAPAARPGRSRSDRSRARAPASSRPSSARGPPGSSLAGLHDQLRPRERAPAVLQELHVLEPPAVHLPPLLEPDRRRQAFLHRGERLHVALDLEVLDREAGPLEEASHARLDVREARGPARLLPLVVVQRDEGEGLTGAQRAARPLGDRIGHAEIGDDEVGLERNVLLDFHVAHDEADVGERGGRGFGRLRLFRRFLISAAESSTSSRRFLMSTTIVSPFRSAAIGPPSAASGAMWPIMKPWVAPEKRPSVISATVSPRPAPWSAPVTCSISRMPGPPLGPSQRMTITSLGLILPAFTAANESSSRSNTRAGPRWKSRFWPETLATHPSGAKLPQGRMSASSGVLREILSNSSIWSLTPASLAMASRCRTALVDPPVAITPAIALCSDLRVMICLGNRPLRRTSIKSLPVSNATS